ncbi:DNA-binding MarR family transcriptional regulator [Motilibacter peucedani]|uniref:DNA-binding MarR family transcriptional regulator n=1 Tax=Motilibacter peucedani TaxID=598650 RepID=A0A420XQA3_9ACTN|nr:MarR family transcriptional regulator [Motilibacter peucedani]RKS75406.1 DNA-binding MarR family transcriptional regulator [Motilibacter peucedani]
MSPTTRAAAGAAPAAQHQLVEQWRDLAGRYARVNEALERELQKGHGLGRTEFELLARLDEAPNRAGRVTELAGEVGLSQSALSRMVDRLEAQGLVERACCVEDRRGVFVELTAVGRGRLGDARPSYDAVLAQHLTA